LSQAHSTPWTIAGPGAIGCLWSCHLQLSGQPVTLVGRRAQILELSLLREDQEQHFAFDILTAEQLSHSIDRLLITTKASQTLDVLNALRPYLNQDSQVVILQNGMAALEASEQFSELKLYAGTTTEGAYRSSAQQLVYAGSGKTLIGPLTDTASTTALTALCKSLAATGLVVEACEDIQQPLWTKLAINCAINALTVQYDCCNGALLVIPEAMNSIHSVCKELQSLIAALAIAGDFADLEAQVIAVLQSSHHNFSSMHQDVKNGRATEVDYLNGFVCRQAQQLGLASQENQRLYQLIKGLSRA
jgi:2-dehydropantoate 2-reductase